MPYFILVGNIFGFFFFLASNLFRCYTNVVHDDSQILFGFCFFFFSELSQICAAFLAWPTDGGGAISGIKFIKKELKALFYHFDRCLFSRCSPHMPKSCLRHQNICQVFLVKDRKKVQIFWGAFTGWLIICNQKVFLFTPKNIVFRHSKAINVDWLRRFFFKDLKPKSTDFLRLFS